jgi:hypothetical protein
VLSASISLCVTNAMRRDTLTGHVNPVEGQAVLLVVRACSLLGAVKSDDLPDRLHFEIVEAAFVVENCLEQERWARQLEACRSAEMEAFQQD